MSFEFLTYRFPIRVMFVALLFFSETSSVKQGGLIGGAEAVRRLLAHRPVSATVSADPFATVRQASEVYRTKMGHMTPAAAADGWLTLMRAWEQAAPVSTGFGSPPDQWAEIMMSALPTPEAWPIIRNGIAKLPATDRRRAEAAVFDDLLGNDSAVLEYLTHKPRVRANVPTEYEDNWPPGASKWSTETLIAWRTGDLDLLAKLYISRVNPLGFSGFEGAPDLVRQLGQPRAADVMRRMLENAQGPVQPFQGKQTQNLARSTVLANLANLKAPQGAPARTMDDYSFVAAQVARFGERKFSFGGFGGAAPMIYTLGLAERGQVDHAVKILSDPRFEAYGDWPSLVKTEEERASLFPIVSQLLERTNADALWGVYEELGRSLGRLSEVDSRLGSALAAKDLSQMVRVALLRRKADLDITLGKTSNAIDELLSVLAQGSGWQEVAARNLLQIAASSDSPDTVTTIAKAAAKIGTARGRLDLYAAYVHQNLIPEAQRAVLSAAQDVQDVNVRAQGQGRLLDAAPDTGVDLAALYYRANQPAQILTLLREFPSWGADDLAALVDYRNLMHWNLPADKETLGFYAAWAFSKTGDRPRAVRILHALLAAYQDSDPPFKLLNDLDGAAALPLYDRLIAAFPFEPRLLVWKADLLERLVSPKTSGSRPLKEAERTLRTAIALIPEIGYDGWFQSGSAYRVLTQILRAEKRNAEAARCDRIVRADQISTRGRFSDVEGVNKYRAALSIFPEDGWSCVALADALCRLGRIPEANAAFLNAIRLVPVSEAPADMLQILSREQIGEGQYRPAVAAEIDRVYRTYPREPRVLAFVGRDREVHDDIAGALAAYEQAVKIAPNYIPGWRRIHELAQKGLTTPQQAREAFLALIRLNRSAPTDYGDDFAAGSFSDKAPLWRAYALASASLMPLNTEPLSSLRASRRALASGAHPFEAMEIKSPLYQSPGAALAKLSELQVLYP